MACHINLWEWLGMLFVLLLGSLSHFFYGWSGKNRLVGLFTAVNESTWEHLKLLFFPMLFYTAAEYFFAGQYCPGFLFAKAVGILAGLLTIVVLFYTYSGVLGVHFLAADILTFAIGVMASFGVSMRLVRLPALSGEAAACGALLLAAMTTAFLLFTVHPPQIGLFCDPLSGGYGFL